jgi:hypothetical protein
VIACPSPPSRLGYQLPGLSAAERFPAGNSGKKN